jgi:hypothetical protein
MVLTWTYPNLSILESTLPLESRRNISAEAAEAEAEAEAGKAKHNPILKIVARIKLCILELPVILIILLPVRDGFQRCGAPDLLNHTVALLFSP